MALDLEVRAHCPNAELVYDLFHVVGKYGHEVIDRVRIDEANRVKADRRARKVLKSSRWFLMRKREDLSHPEQDVHLELLVVNRSLMSVYVLKEDLKQLWRYHPVAMPNGHGRAGAVGRWTVE